MSTSIDPEWIVRYERAWRGILSRWLDWEPTRVDDWIAGWRDEMTKSTDFYHEKAVWYVIPLISGALFRRMETSHELKRQFERELTFAADPTTNAITEAGYDWDAGRARAEEVLHKYKLSWPSSSVATDYERRMSRIGKEEKP